MCYLGPRLVPSAATGNGESYAMEWRKNRNECTEPYNLPVLLLIAWVWHDSNSHRLARLELHSGIKLAGSLPQWYLSMDFKHYNVIDSVPVNGEILTVTQRWWKDLLALVMVVFLPCMWKTVLMDIFLEKINSGYEKNMWHTVKIAFH